jgi:hypothetical protein
MGAAASLLKEKHHGVLISVVQLCTELCKASTEALEYLRKVQCMTRAMLFFPWRIIYTHNALFFPGELSTHIMLILSKLDSNSYLFFITHLC